MLCGLFAAIDPEQGDLASSRNKKYIGRIRCNGNSWREM
jgi:hypothetical protein